jgi:hypothetical protein
MFWRAALFRDRMNSDGKIYREKNLGEVKEHIL